MHLIERVVLEHGLERTHLGWCPKGCRVPSQPTREKLFFLRPYAHGFVTMAARAAGARLSIVAPSPLRQVLSCSIKRDPHTGASKRFGFVALEEGDVARALCAPPSSRRAPLQLDGARLEVRPANSGHGGGGGSSRATGGGGAAPSGGGGGGGSRSAAPPPRGVF